MIQILIIFYTFWFDRCKRSVCRCSPFGSVAVSCGIGSINGLSTLSSSSVPSFAALIVSAMDFSAFIRLRKLYRPAVLRNRRRQVLCSSCFFSQKLLPPPLCVLPEDEVCVLLPSESEDFSVRATVRYRKKSRELVTCILPSL